MKRLVGVVRVAAAVTLLPVMLVQQSFAWGSDGHMMINRLAAAALPADVPAFLRTARRWMRWSTMGRSRTGGSHRAENELSVTQSPDHFIDLEWADYADVPCTAGQNGCPASGKDLPRHRYDFIRAVEKARLSHPDLQLTPEKVGFQPCMCSEV